MNPLLLIILFLLSTIAIPLGLEVIRRGRDSTLVRAVKELREIFARKSDSEDLNVRIVTIRRHSYNLVSSAVVTLFMFTLVGVVLIAAARSPSLIALIIIVVVVMAIYNTGHASGKRAGSRRAFESAKGAGCGCLLFIFSGLAGILFLKLLERFI